MKEQLIFNSVDKDFCVCLLCKQLNFVIAFL